MEFRTILFFLGLVNDILARPESFQAFVSPCEVWSLNGQYVKDYSEEIQTNIFNYTCVEQSRCDKFEHSVNVTEVDIRGTIFNLHDDIVAANKAQCPNQGDICCPGRFVLPPPLQCPSTSEKSCVDRLIDLLNDHNDQSSTDEATIRRTKSLENFLRKACELTEDFTVEEIHKFLGKLNSDSSIIQKEDNSDRPCCESESCRKINGKFFYFEKKKLSFEDAKQNCISKAEGTRFTGRLFEPQSKAENNYVIEAAALYSPKYPDFWIGIRTAPTERRFRFVSGGTIFDNWSNGEPNDAEDGEDCVVVHKSHGIGKWNDDNCSKNWGSICEFVHR